MLKQELKKIVILFAVGLILGLLRLKGVDFGNIPGRSMLSFIWNIVAGMLICGALTVGVVYGIKKCGAFMLQMFKNTMSMSIGAAMFGKVFGGLFGGLLVTLLCIALILPASFFVGIVELIAALINAREIDIYNSRL